MKKQLWLAAAFAGMLFGTPALNAHAAVNVNVNVNAGSRPGFVIDRRPDFVVLPTMGFSVAVGSPYDIITYNNVYYIHRDGNWYVSQNYRGPWKSVRANRLPGRIRAHRWDDIRRSRDIEYRRHANNGHDRGNRFDDGRRNDGPGRDGRFDRHEGNQHDGRQGGRD